MLPYSIKTITNKTNVCLSLSKFFKMHYKLKLSTYFLGKTTVKTVPIPSLEVKKIVPS
jgi:hypothetical protein